MTQLTLFDDDVPELNPGSVRGSIQERFDEFHSGIDRRGGDRPGNGRDIQEGS